MQTLKRTTKPTKQRRMLYQAPDHIRYKLFSAPLSAELQASHGVGTLPVRSGDTVRIMRGDHKGFEGKISEIDRSSYRIYVEGLTREKVDGTAIFVPVHPSKVRIIGLTLDDKWRKKILERKKQAKKIVRTAGRKPTEKIAEPVEEVVEKKPTRTKKVEAKKPRAKKKRAAKKPAEKTVQEEKEKAEGDQKPKAKKQARKVRTAEKTGGT